LRGEPSKGIIPQAISVVSYYALWFITGALGLLDLVVARRVLLEVHFALRLNPWTLAAVDKFGLLILGIIWLVLFLLCEEWYRRAAALSLSRLLKRFAVVTAAQVASLGVAAGMILLVI